MNESCIRVGCCLQNLRQQWAVRGELFSKSPQKLVMAGTTKSKNIKAQSLNAKYRIAYINAPFNAMISDAVAFK